LAHRQFMKVRIIKPYRHDKNLGKAYNEEMATLDDDDWNCLCDLDTCFLTPDAGTILEEYARQNPDAGILTCFTNRISTLSKMQLLNGRVDENSDMKHHVRLAEDQRRFLYNTTEIDRDISGMVMLISKRTWSQYKFTENIKCLGVDTEFNRRIRSAGKRILRMDGLYIWHTYRILNGITSKTHLQ
jgi:GT2 family glycosyltransferase